LAPRRAIVVAYGVPMTRRGARVSTGRTALAAHVAELLHATDAHLASRTAWRTLDPDATAPRTLVALGQRILPARSDRPALHEQQEIAWAMAISDLARAIARDFPQNIFADLDHVGSALRDVVAREGHVALERTIDPLVRIHRTYGRRSAIRFRYVHDFLYGFDWTRWVARDPAARAAVGPYALPFLAHIEARAVELAALVEAGDPSYPPLAPDSFRNPFPFDREPDSEARLFLALARAGELPIEAFRESPPLSFERPYAALREARAESLGLSSSLSVPGPADLSPSHSRSS